MSLYFLNLEYYRLILQSLKYTLGYLFYTLQL